MVLPTRNVAETIGPILARVALLNDRSGLIDQVMLVDADSTDGTGDIARACGAEVNSENELLPAFGPAQGKGDAMWRSLSVARGDIVMFADADTNNFDEHFIYGTLGPLLALPGLQFTKAAYRRPYTDGQQSVIDGGGRVTELMAKPLFNFFCPELTGFVQPLAGEFAAYRDLLCGIPFLTGYGVELGIMVDVLRAVGLPAMAQVDLGARQNRPPVAPGSHPDELGGAARDDPPGARAATRGLRVRKSAGQAAPRVRHLLARRGHRAGIAAR